MNRGRLTGKLIMGLGVLLLLCSAALLIYNSAQEKRAETYSEQVIERLDMTPILSEQEEILPDYIVNPAMDMPAREIDSRLYVGTVSIPALELTLPVLKSWSDENFKVAPCVYEGTAYMDNLIIAAHNYRKHFGSLDELKEGDRVVFRDMAGNSFEYRVMYREILDKAAVEEMSAGDWELTLFTCTYGGAERVTVRCERI